LTASTPPVADHDATRNVLDGRIAVALVGRAEGVADDARHALQLDLEAMAVLTGVVEDVEVAGAAGRLRRRGAADQEMAASWRSSSRVARAGATVLQGAAFMDRILVVGLVVRSALSRARGVASRVPALVPARHRGMPNDGRW
jgi:hypothetical protein